MECPICCADFSSAGQSRPIMINCGHSFCVECLKKLRPSFHGEMGEYWYDAVNRTRNYKCPTCRERITNTDFDSMPTNYALIVESSSETLRLLKCPKHDEDCKYTYICYTHSNVFCVFNQNEKCCTSCSRIERESDLNLSIILSSEFQDLGDFEHDILSLYHEKYIDLLKVEKEVNAASENLIKIIKQNREAVIVEIRQNRKNLENWLSVIRKKYLTNIPKLFQNIQNLTIYKRLLLKKELKGEIEKIYHPIHYTPKSTYIADGYSIKKDFSKFLENSNIYGFMNKRFQYVKKKEEGPYAWEPHYSLQTNPASLLHFYSMYRPDYLPRKFSLNLWTLCESTNYNN